MTMERHEDALQALREARPLSPVLRTAPILLGGDLCMLHNILIKYIVFKGYVSSAEGCQPWVQ